ncbi:MAG TPA: hypothetical protein VN857_07725 [Chthoniobacterales bacterium]|jgi:hypothetical protein|nr:hypothetical protein [Chthoniobacterales bacterium]
MNSYRIVRLPRCTEVRAKEAADIIASVTGHCTIGKVYDLMANGFLDHRSVPPRSGSKTNRGARLITVASIEEYLKVAV